jgi:hypothetical protein
MLEKARYAAQLLRRRKIIAAARATFSFPIEDLPPRPVRHIDDDTVIMREGLQSWRVPDQAPVAG